MSKSMATAYQMKKRMGKPKMAEGGFFSGILGGGDKSKDRAVKNTEESYKGYSDPKDRKRMAEKAEQDSGYAKGGDVGGAETSTTGNKTKTGGSNPGGASTGGAGTVTITTGKMPPKGINISNVGGKTAARNAGGMDPSDEDDDMMMAKGGEIDDHSHDDMVERVMCRRGSCCYAEGGQVTDNYQSPRTGMHQSVDNGVQEKLSGFVDHEGNNVKRNGPAMTEDDRRLGQHGAHEEGPTGVWMAGGGQITGNYQSEDDDQDMVGRIMKQRQQMYSKGGRVANNVHSFEYEQDTPANYDDLSLRDTLESTSNGSNNGDFRGNDQKDEDERDIVARVMKSRAKKDRLPRSIKPGL